MTPILISLASFIGFVAFAALLGAAYVIVGLIWAAKGSPDVNGDPERDATQSGSGVPPLSDSAGRPPTALVHDPAHLNLL